MIKDNLNKLIMEAMKVHDNIKTEALRAVKTSILNWQSAKENIGKEYNEAVEINLIKKLVAQYEDTVNQCNDGKHDELVKNALDSAGILKEYLPAPISEDDIYAYFVELTNNGIEPVKKNMGAIIKGIKAKYPSADGKLVSQIVMKHLN